MSGRFVIGIDDGTQSIRMILYDEKGKIINSATAKHAPLIVTQPGWAEHDSHDLWESFCRASNELMGKFSGKVQDIVGIGLSSQRDTIVAVDQNCNMLHNPISWLDNRREQNYLTLTPATRENVTKYEHSVRLRSRVNWHKLNRPDIYEKAYKYLTMGGYYGYKLTGNYVDSVSNNNGWPYDPKTFTIADASFCEEAGLSRAIMAEIVQSCSLIGNILPNASEITGFPNGCPVYTSGGDKQCELAGAGAMALDQAYISLGTQCTAVVVTDKFIFPDDLCFHPCFSLLPGFFNNEVFVDKGFWTVSWFRDNLASDMTAVSEETGLSVEDLLNREAERVPVGSEGLVVLPDWQAPQSRPNSKGLFLGFDERHGRAHMYRALIEGILLDINYSFGKMNALLGSRPVSLRLGGGGSKSSLVAQITADIFGLPVIRTEDSETCSLGAAMCATVGSGIYSSLAESAEMMVYEKDVFDFLPENHQIYRLISETVSKQLYPCLREVFDALKEIR